MFDINLCFKIYRVQRKEMVHLLHHQYRQCPQRYGNQGWTSWRKARNSSVTRLPTILFMGFTLAGLAWGFFPILFFLFSYSVLKLEKLEIPVFIIKTYVPPIFKLEFLTFFFHELVFDWMESYLLWSECCHALTHSDVWIFWLSLNQIDFVLLLLIRIW